MWISLNLAQRLIYKNMDSILKDQGLPPLRWYDVLWELDRTPGEGLRPFELEKFLLFEQSNLSRLLRRMIDAGLVEELIFSDDRRGKILKITDKGSTIRAQMWAIYGSLIHKHISRIAGDHDLEQMTQALRGLVDETIPKRFKSRPD
jgi:DNA-binding MarR family transcriptional regulator